MPTFEQIPVEITVEGQTVEINVNVDFEVYCGTCGKGLCSVSDTRKSRGRSYPQVTVDACPDCLDERDMEIAKLKERIEELERAQS